MAPRYVKTILCLANSRKNSGRCLAGKEIIGDRIGRWIRPISQRPTCEVSEEERRFQNGRDPKLLDVVTIPLVEPKPFGFQTENHLIDDGYYWAKEREASWDELRSALDMAGAPLWDNSSWSRNGLHDRVREATANTLECSLRLIEVRDFKIVVAIEGVEFQKRKVRGHFTFNRVGYWLSVTDPIIERRFFAGKDGEFKIGDAILCISLGEPFEGFAYKLIAGVFIEG